MKSRSIVLGLLLATLVAILAACAPAQGPDNYNSTTADTLKVQLVAKGESGDTVGWYEIVLLSYVDPVTGEHVQDLCRTWWSYEKGGTDCERVNNSQ